MDPLVDAIEVSKVLNVPVTWVWKQGREGKIPCYRVGKYMRFNLKEVVEFLRNESQEPALVTSARTRTLLREVI